MLRSVIRAASCVRCAGMLRHLPTARALLPMLLVAGLCEAQEPRPAPDDYVPRKFESRTIHYGVRPGLQTPQRYHFEKRFQSGLNCGPNALFVTLRLCGVEVTWDEVKKRVPVGPRGSTLKDLAEAAKSFGLAASPRTNLTPEAIRKAPKPLILHINIEPSDAQPERRDHFIVITRSPEGGGYSGVDTTNALYTQFSDDFIVRNMTGHALVLGRPSFASRVSSYNLVLGAILATLLGGNLVLACAGRSKRKRTNP